MVGERVKEKVEVQAVLHRQRRIDGGEPEKMQFDR